VTIVRTWPGDVELRFKQRTQDRNPHSRSGKRRGARTSLARYCPLCDPYAAIHAATHGQWLLSRWSP
jgi:hypothetical protein